MRLTSPQYRWMVTLLFLVCLCPITMRSTRVRTVRSARAGMHREVDVEHDAHLHQQTRGNYGSAQIAVSHPVTPSATPVSLPSPTAAFALMELNWLPVNHPRAAIPPGLVDSHFNRGPPHV